MRSMPSVVIAAFVLVAVSACSTSHSSPPAKIHAKTVAQQGQQIIDAQKQAPSLQTAGQFCLAGIEKDSKDATVNQALNNIDPTGGEATAWQLYNLDGDQVTMKKELAGGKTFAGTFDLGQIIYAI